MFSQQKISSTLYQAIESQRMSFHNAIKIYRYISMYAARNKSPSGQILVKELSSYLLEATKPSQNKAWTSVLFPTELLYAFDIMPLTLEVIGGVLSKLSVSKHFLSKAEANDTPATMCTFHRILLGLAHSNFLSTPNLVAATSLMCDGNVKSFAEAARTRNIPFIFLDVPYEKNSDSIHYVKEQLNQILHQLSDLTHKAYTPEMLRPVINNANQAFSLYRKVYNLLMQNTKNLFQGHEQANFAFPYHFLLGSQRLVKILDKRKHDLINGQKHNRFFNSLHHSKSVKRLMWLHIVPQYTTPIWEIIDNGMSARVVCDEYSSVSYNDYDLNDPLKSIACRLIDHPSNGPLNRRLDHILKVAYDFQIDGFIHYSSWGCHQASGNVTLLEDALRSANYNFINLNGDPADDRHSSFEQHRTRLEAFMEVL